ncbi:hypothetical protein Pcinc_023818 [Petrolisthes cinctipes]|uniref:Methyltransferase domain-containing protein n=1 Tax=Petrolisthes cinctipes TaxID=88211 RepID=A0AAE1FDL5_PETCI|nr:hypothetical protein Pcinc_023818 [Petrolisthes cinctipes]
MPSLRRHIRSSPVLWVTGVAGWMWVCSLALMGSQSEVGGGGIEGAGAGGGGGIIGEGGIEGGGRVGIIGGGGGTEKVRGGGGTEKVRGGGGRNEGGGGGTEKVRGRGGGEGNEGGGGGGGNEGGGGGGNEGGEGNEGGVGVGIEGGVRGIEGGGERMPVNYRSELVREEEEKEVEEEVKKVVKDDPPKDPWDPTHLSQMLNQPTSTCRRLASLGGHLWCGDCHTCLIDGNKYTCFDPDVRPVAGECLVYSVGVGGEVSWDVALTHYNCSVYALDMTLTDWTNGMLQEGLHFLDVGLSNINSDGTINMTSADATGEDRKWEWKKVHFRTLEEVRDILGHNHRQIDILKLDIEHMEWEVLGAMLASPEKARILDDVKQIALEIHLDGFKNESVVERVEEGRRVEEVLTALHSRGFHLVHTELNTSQQAQDHVTSSEPRDVTSIPRVTSSVHRDVIRTPCDVISTP